MLLTRNGNRDNPLGVWRIQEQLNRGGQIAARRQLDVRAELVCLFVARREFAIRAANHRPETEAARAATRHHPCTWDADKA